MTTLPPTMAPTRPAAGASAIPEVATVALPVLGHSVRTLRKALAEPSADWHTVSNIMLSDPALTVHALRQVIGSERKSMRSDAVSLRQAAILLGVDKLVALCKSLPVLEETLPPTAREGYLRTLSRCFHAAYQARDWAGLKRDLYTEEVFVAAFLHDIADMALWVTKSDKMQHIERLLDDGVPIDEAEYVALGDSTGHFARAMASYWHLPDLIHEALRPENTMGLRVKHVVLAVRLADAAEKGWDTAEMHGIIEQVAEHLQLPADEVSARIHTKAAEAARASWFFGTLPAAALLPRLPEPGADAPAANPETATADVHTHMCLLPQRNKYAEAVHYLETHLGQLDLNDVMRRVMHGMHDGIALNRVVFYMLSKDRKSLEPRFMVGTDSDPAFNLYRINLGIPHLLARLLEKPQSVWIKDDNRAKYWPLVPRDFKDLIRTNSFYAHSIAVGGKPLGLFYADRHSEDCHLDEDSYRQFRHLCQLAATGIATPGAAGTR